jgi:hypothetical protein
MSWPGTRREVRPVRVILAAPVPGPTGTAPLAGTEIPVAVALAELAELATVGVGAVILARAAAGVDTDTSESGLLPLLMTVMLKVTDAPLVKPAGSVGAVIPALRTPIEPTLADAPSTTENSLAV